MFKIGNVEINNRVVLAPMAGVSNPAYIKICEEMGVGYAVTELMSSEAIIRNSKKTFDMLKGLDSIKIPIGAQIFGSNPSVMAQAAKILVDNYHIKIIDINMGCPVPKVAVKSEAGSALLKNPDKVRDIVKAVVKSVNIPVTVKIRSGWDSDSINAPLIAKIAEEAGASAIFVHGRTRSQGYSGKVSLDVIKSVKESVSIPVIGNGDIVDIESAEAMLQYTGCDAIMIGRGALGNPWLIKRVVAYLDRGKILDEPSYKEKIEMCFHHLNYLMKIKPEKVAILEMRSNAVWYIKGMPGAQSIKGEIFKVNNYSEFEKVLNNYLKELNNVI